MKEIFYLISVILFGISVSISFLLSNKKELFFLDTPSQLMILLFFLIAFVQEYPYSIPKLAIYWALVVVAAGLVTGFLLSVQTKTEKELNDFFN